VIQFINHSLLQLIPSDFKDLPENRGDIASTELLSRLAKDKSNGGGTKVPFTSLYGDNINEAHLFHQVVHTALNLIDISSALWKHSVAFPELFRETFEILKAMKSSKLPSSLITSIDVVKSALGQRTKLSLGSRASLTLQAHRPIPIPSYLPKYSMSYSLDSKNDPDHERSSLGKLRAQHRREKKSVIRELRKEARTEAVVKSDEGRRRDKAYAEKMRIATGIMKGGNAGIGKWERDQKRKRK
jgi:nucleolar protein 14